MTITAIGFTNKYYTLWEIYEETRPLGNGCNYVITHFNYIKNISFDKETALAKYPNAKLDENLHGKTTSWESSKEVWYNVDTFRFGKYKYMKIDENTDTTYIEWYWNNIYDEHKDFVTKVLESRGYEVRTWGNNNQYLMSPEALENEKREQTEMEKTLNAFKSGENTELLIESNPDEDGNYRNGNVLYHFQEVKENYYQGFSYYLPVSKGKAKRVKNKTIIIKNYTYTLNNGELDVEILDFEIKK